MKGQIIKIISDLHVVSCGLETIACKCRGKFRKDQITPRVGDYVIFDKEKKVIREILPRKNSFERPRVANIDQAFLVTSLITPNLSLNLLDKLIILMELHHVKPIICITKSDLISEKELNNIKTILAYYEQIGYIVVYNTDLVKINQLLENKTSVFTGQTGAGKSTLLNKLNPNWQLKTGEISKALGRGKHTTKVVELFELDNKKILDTPGFSALEFNDYNSSEIRDAFVEFKKYKCAYKDCMHNNEQNCMVKEAVNANNIIRSRYNNYLKFIERK